jgi:hypothetical protein
MKLTATSILALALGAQATNVVRDLATIQKVITDIQAQTQALDTAVKAYTSDFGPVQSAATALQNLIVSGTTTVNSQPVLSLLDASQTAQTVTDLSTVVTSVVNDLISKKATFVSNGKAADVLQTLQSQKSDSQALADALTSKVPSELQSVAAQLSAAISDALTTGINAFMGLSGPSSSSSAASSSVGSATSSSSTISSSSVGTATSVVPSSSSGWATPTSKTGGHSGHPSKTLTGTGGATSSAGATWSSPALSSTSAAVSVTASKTALPLYTGAAVARGFNGALAIAAAAAFVF